MPYVDIVNIGSGNALLFVGTKPLSEPIFTYIIKRGLWHSPEKNFGKSAHELIQ